MCQAWLRRSLALTTIFISEGKKMPRGLHTQYTAMFVLAIASNSVFWVFAATVNAAADEAEAMAMAPRNCLRNMIKMYTNNDYGTGIRYCNIKMSVSRKVSQREDANKRLQRRTAKTPRKRVC